MAHLAISFLGSLGISLNGRPVSRLKSAKAQALLAYVALERGHPHRREVLAGLLWPDEPDTVALHNLRQALSQLRTAIGDREADPPFLHATRTTLAFNSESEHWLDVDAFTDALVANRAHPHRRIEECPTCAGRLEEAAGLYRGDLMSDFSVDSAPFEEWLVVQREELHLQALEVLSQLAAYHEGQGEYEGAIGYARRQLELEPWREEAHRQLIRALVLSGQRGAALVQYEACRAVLAEELSAEPAAETRALVERIRGGVDLADAFPSAPNNLPAALTPFVGRHMELAELEGLLEGTQSRLVTLLGPGGIGKTHLALQAARACLGRFQDGVFLVELYPLQSADAIVPAIAQTLGLSAHAAFGSSEEADLERQLLNYLRQKRMLLVLDGFEHLLDGADVVIRVLQAGRQVRVLVTSRAALSMPGEQILSVTGMDYPTFEGHTSVSLDPFSAGLGREDSPIVQYSAVRLFLTGARRSRAAFEPTGDDLLHIVRICQLVQGMPLAILMAAAWTKLLTLAEIVAELTQGQELLGAEWHGLPRHQRSMRAVFDRSWGLLSPREQEVLAGLSVFRGGFDRQAAQRIVGASLQDLMGLVAKSLLQRTRARRIEMHELIRHYATGKLSLWPHVGQEVMDRHSAYYTGALQGWESELKGPQQQAALAEMGTEIENAHAAWKWALQRARVEWLSQAIDGLCRFYEWRGRYREGEAACREVVDGLGAVDSSATMTAEDRERLRAKALAWQGVFGCTLGRAESGAGMLQQSLSVLRGLALGGQDTRRERASALFELARVVEYQSSAQARQLLSQSLHLYREADDQWGVAKALDGLGWDAIHAMAYDAGRDLHDEALALRRALGDWRGVADSLVALGRVAWAQERNVEAEASLRESLAICQQMGDLPRTAFALHILANELSGLSGRYLESCALHEQSIAIFEELGFRRESAFSRLMLGVTRRAMGQYAQARCDVQIALDLCKEIGNRRGIAWALSVLGSTLLAEEVYTEAEQLLEEGTAILRQISNPEGLHQALVWSAISARGLGHLGRAEQHLIKAAKLAGEGQGVRQSRMWISAMSLILADRGDVARALELYALASRGSHAVEGWRWDEDVIGRHITAAAQSLPPEVVAAAQERGQARDLHSTVEELLAELEGWHRPLPGSRDLCRHRLG